MRMEENITAWVSLRSVRRNVRHSNLGVILLF